MPHRVREDLAARLRLADRDMGVLKANGLPHTTGLVGELVRGITGRSPGEFFAEEVDGLPGAGRLTSGKRPNHHPNPPPRTARSADPTHPGRWKSSQACRHRGKERVMARLFGLVALLVALYTATNDHTMHFHQQPRKARVGRSTKKKRSTRGDLDFLTTQLYEQAAYLGSRLSRHPLKRRQIMTFIPAGFMYTAEDEWILVEDRGHVLAVGFTDHGLRAIGDIRSVELPRIGVSVMAGETVCAIEGFQGSAILHSPASGQIIESNETIANHPQTANGDPYSYWLFKVAMSDDSQAENLLTPEAYGHLIGAV
jgi:glycine cleavage system H protein